MLSVVEDTDVKVLVPNLRSYFFLTISANKGL
jgi:hypothetical protein